MVAWCAPSSHPKASRRLVASVATVAAGMLAASGGQGLLQGLGTVFGLGAVVCSVATTLHLKGLLIRNPDAVFEVGQVA
jgi:hypothetical protein